MIFYECSACSGHNAQESLLHLARLLKEQEDTVRNDTIQEALRCGCHGNSAGATCCFLKAKDVPFG